VVDVLRLVLAHDKRIRSPAPDPGWTTAVQYALPVIIVVIDNAMYGTTANSNWYG